MRYFLQSRLSPFKYPAFRSFFIVQGLSQIGTWSSDLAKSWIVLDQLGAAAALGSLLLARALPGLFFILHGGVIVDRLNAQKLLIFTKALFALLSVSLGLLVLFIPIQLWHLLLFALAEGLINSLDTPAYQSLYSRLVPRKDFQQALALNVTNFHTGRMMGPLVAGLLMAAQGPALVFFFDALSYVFLILLLVKLKLQPRPANTSSPNAHSSFHNLLKGLQYIWQTPRIRYTLSQLLLNVCLMFPLVIVVFRAYMQITFHLSAEQFGYVFSFPALGALLSAICFTALKPQNPLRVLWFAIPLLPFFSILVTLTSHLFWATFFLSLSGFFANLAFSTLTVTTHLFVKEEFRGRVASFIGLSFLSIGPLMTFPIGYVADLLGYKEIIYLLSFIYLILSGLLALKVRAEKSSSSISHN
ncbi:MAG: MFS transporter [Bdellovibrio sp.]|nr:MAG: MFS transporter [Bdellovibrio sp.]